MNELTKTLSFVILAILLLGAAAWSNTRSTGGDEAEFALVGEPFFPDYTDPNEANGLNVVRYDEDTATADRFAIQSKDGRWIIPSHYDYPADAREQLAKTAASVVGIERGALAGRRSADFERLGVVDPLNEESTTLTGRGNRITLIKDGKPLTDLIIGKKAEDQADMYYVRRPDEDQTYLASLDIDLSTKFTDWIEDDLLSLEKSNLKQIVVHRYSVDQDSGRLLDQGFYTLTQPEGSTDFTLEDLKPDEEIQTAKVNSLINQLDDLRIVGVRPKPEGLSSDLKLNKDVSQDLLTSLNLQGKGFYFMQERSGEMRLVSNEGELAALTKDGLTYVMHFGAIVTGDDEEIEIGFAKADDETTTDAPTTEDKPGTAKNRYLFLTVNFDAASLGEKPVKPTKPDEPKAEEPQPEETKAEETKPEATPSADQPDASEPTEATPADAAPAEPAEAPETDEAKPDPKAAYELALKDYEAQLKVYEDALKAYNDKLAEGKKKAKDLNARFADWYYVISGDSFEDFSLQRSDLVKAKTPEATPAAETSTPDTTTSPDQPGSTTTTSTQPESPPTQPESPATTPSTSTSSPGTDGSDSTPTPSATPDETSSLPPDSPSEPAPTTSEN